MPTTFRFGVVSSSFSSLKLDLDGDGESKLLSPSSSVLLGEVVAEDETSPLRMRGLERERLSEREEEEGVMMVLSGSAGGRPTAREGEEGCRERVRCLLGERDIGWSRVLASSFDRLPAEPVVGYVKLTWRTCN